MYLSIENFTCPKEQISLYCIVLQQFILSKTVWNQIYISTLANSMDPDQLASLVNSVDPDQLAFEVASLSGSILFSMQDVSS